MLNIPEQLYPPEKTSWFQIAAGLPEERRVKLFTQLRDNEANFVAEDWMLRARREQLPPSGDWFLWLVVAGRGFGKNYCGSNVFIEAHRQGLAKSSVIVAATTGDLRKYCLEGPSGILSLAPISFQPKYVPSRAGGGILLWPNDTITNLYSSEKPRRIRGANVDLAWCDELSWWQYPQETWDSLMFACRFGTPRIIVTMTPRPIPLVKELIGREDGKRVVVTRGATTDNIANLSEVYLEEIVKPYEGTSLGRQELHGELLMDVDGALWTHEQLEELVEERPDKFDKVVVGVDPSTTTKGNECGIIVAGKIGNTGYVLGDHSLQGSPDTWARRVVTAYHSMKEVGKSCSVVVEQNQGGEMVSSILRGIEPTLPIKLVHASVGKVARAEPIAAAYEQGRVKHCGHFPKLEDEMCLFVPGEMKQSPNRVDALVWALTHLVVNSRGMGRVRAWGRKKAA